MSAEGHREMTLKRKPQREREHNRVRTGTRPHLDDFGADLEGAGAELLTCAERVLSVHHADVGAASGRNHLHADMPHTHKKEKTNHIRWDVRRLNNKMQALISERSKNILTSLSGTGRREGGGD